MPRFKPTADRHRLSEAGCNLSFSFWPGRVEISDLSKWVDGSELSNLWEIAWIYQGRVKISDLSTWVNGSDLSNLWPIDKITLVVSEAYGKCIPGSSSHLVMEVDHHGSVEQGYLSSRNASSCGFPDPSTSSATGHFLGQLVQIF